MGNSKGKIKVKVTPKRKPIKPNGGKGMGGFLSARIVAEVKKKKSNKK